MKTDEYSMKIETERTEMQEQDLDSAIFTVADIERATDVDAMTIRNWFQRKIFVLDKMDKPSEGQGKARMFSARTALSVGIAKLVVDAGLSPAVGAKAGVIFSHVGGTDFTTGYERNPGMCFDDSTSDTVFTFLSIPTYRQDHPNILPVTPESTNIMGLFERIQPIDEFGKPESALLIRLDQEVRFIKHKLDHLTQNSRLKQQPVRPRPKASGWVGEDN